MSYRVHVFLFGSTALLCLGIAEWIRRRAEDRAGTMMVGLLVLNAVWAGLIAIQLSVPSRGWQTFWFYLWQPVSFVIPAVWLAFTLVYTGRDYWLTRPAIGSLAVTTLGPVTVLLTDRYHGLIGWDPQWTTQPFPHLVGTVTIEYLLLLLFLYVYLIGGLVALGHLFVRSRNISRVQSATLFSGALVPIAINAATIANVLPAPGVDYTALGSAVFGIAVGWALFTSRLFAVTPLARDVALEVVDDGIVLVDESLSIVDYNARAIDLLPALESNGTGSLADVCPELVDETGAFHSRITAPDADSERQLVVEETSIDREGRHYGFILVIRDVTEIESYAQELEAKTERLEQFASLVSHDLRNPVAVAHGYADLAMKTDDTSQLESALDALDRIDEQIDVLLTLSRDGDPADHSPVALDSTVTDAWETSDTGQASLVVDLDTVHVMADRPTLRELFENLFRNSVDHGSTDNQRGSRADDSVDHGSTNSRPQADDADDRSVTDGSATTDESEQADVPRGVGVTVRVGTLSDRDGFFVEDDGPGIPPPHREAVFEYGFTTDTRGTGYGLAIVETFAENHGWTVSITDGTLGGARFEFSGVTILDNRAVSSATHD